MSIGLLNLVNIGKENIYLSSNPEITFFKTVYKRYTNFSIEQIPQFFNTTPDFNKKCSIVIGKNADLIHKMYLYIELPEINIINDKFKWSDKIGLVLIKQIEINIGGITIDKHCMEWLNIWNELTIPINKRKSYNIMICNTDDEHIYKNNVKKKILYIPLIFWFCNNIGSALPIISLKNNDIKIYIEFNDIDKCYNISPSNYININENYCLFKNDELIYQYVNNNKIIGKFNYFDFKEKKLYYTKLKDIFIIPKNNENVGLTITNDDNSFTVSIKLNSVVIDNKIFNEYNKPSILTAYMLIDYIYIDNEERKRYLKNELDYIITYVQTVPERLLNTIYTTYTLPLYNCVKLLCWRTISKNNRITNNHFIYNNQYFVDNNDIINNNLLILNSINITELNHNIFYTFLQKYLYNYKNINSKIYSYSFAINPICDEITGSINFSMLNESYLKLSLTDSVNFNNSVYIQAFALTYNIIRVKDGELNLLFDA